MKYEVTKWVPTVTSPTSNHSGPSSGWWMWAPNTGWVRWGSVGTGGSMTSPGGWDDE